jgi:hypothetical protein
VHNREFSGAEVGDLSFARCFGLRPGGIECDANGLRVGGVALLARDAHGAWTTRDERDLDGEHSKRYGLPLDIGRKRGGVGAVAAALTKGELARAQIAALLLRLPDPPASASARFDALEKRRLAGDLAACGLLKADADWDERHPRTGAPPNPGWFAPTQGAASDEPETSQSPAASAPPHGSSALVFPPPAAAPVGSALAENLTPGVLSALARLAARFSVATILFDTIFVPSESRLVAPASPYRRTQRSKAHPQAPNRLDHLLAPTLAARAEYPADVEVETLADGAALVTLCEEPFSKEDEAGLARLHALEAALRPIQS